MVKVLQCYNFKSKGVISIQDEPLAICANDTRVFVATRRCAIVVFSVKDEDIKETRRFDTVSLVDKLLFSSAKNYLLALEYQQTWKNMTKFIRVYLNWDTEAPPDTKIRSKVRLAGRTQHSVPSGKTVIEIPVDKNISDICVCQSTGNFALSVNREVKVFHVVEKVTPNTGSTYQDVEVFLELCWNFSILSVSLCEEYLACSAISECQVIRLEYDDVGEAVVQRRSRCDKKKSENKESDAKYSSLTELYSASVTPVTVTNINNFSSVGVTRSSNPSPAALTSAAETTATGGIRDDEFYQTWHFDCEDSESRQITLPGLKVKSKLQVQKGSPPVLHDLRGGRFKSLGVVKASTLLHLVDPDNKEDWQEIRLIPSYLHSITTVTADSYNPVPVRSPDFDNLCGMCCLVSGFQGSLMYSLLPRVEKTTVYKYTTSATKVLPTMNLLHVVTKTGLETYTSRCGISAIHNLEQFDYITQACPPANLETCLIGIQPFIGPVEVTMTTDHVILLTKFEEPFSEESQWGLYVLEKNKPSDTYKDMMNFATRVKDTGPLSYLHLVEEGHMMLKTKMTLSAKSDSIVDNLFLDSCALLGEYYSLPTEDDEDWYLCLPYYLMSQQSVDDIISRAEVNKQQNKQDTLYRYGKGLVNYLNYVLFQDENLEVKEVTANTILEIYLNTEPDKLTEVILLSRLSNYNAEKAMELVKRWIEHKDQRGEKASGHDLLALTKLSLLICEPEAAESTLSSVDEKSLVEICVSPVVLIQKDSSEFTPLAQLMRQHHSHSFLLILVDLFDKGLLTVDGITQLLQTNPKEENYKSNQLKEFYEIFVNDNKRRYIFEDIVLQLCTIYFKRIIHQIHSVRPTGKSNLFHLPQGSGHFAARFSWLDYLPPFSGPDTMTRVCLHHTRGVSPGSRHPGVVSSVPVTMTTGKKEEKCPCCFCNEDLLKLQSLLCSPHLNHKNCMNIFEMIKSQTNMVGWESLWLLCNRHLDLKQATEFVIDRFPLILPRFASSSFGVDTSQWQHCLQFCETILKEFLSTHQAEKEEIYVKVYRDILMELVELFPPDEFLNFLPADGSLYFLLPYLMKCVNRHQTKQLKEIIVKKGTEYLKEK